MGKGNADHGRGLGGDEVQEVAVCVGGPHDGRTAPCVPPLRFVVRNDYDNTRFTYQLEQVRADTQKFFIWRCTDITVDEMIERLISKYHTKGVAL